jgi:hypothetical protein
MPKKENKDGNSPTIRSVHGSNPAQLQKSLSTMNIEIEKVEDIMRRTSRNKVMERGGKKEMHRENSIFMQKID